MAETDPWKTRSDEEEAEDLFLEEGGDEETERERRKAQDELKNAGMLLVSARRDWEAKLKETLIQACKDETKNTLASDDTIFENVEKASKATCLVVRRTNSKCRLEYLEKTKDYKRLKKAQKGKGGTGTGFLMSPESRSGWLVMTNNHVIMDEEEAKSAEVYFDHLDDYSKENTKCFKVKQLVSKDIPTKHSKDFTSLDFSVLALESDETPEDTKFLNEHAMLFDDTGRVSVCRHATILNMCGLNFSPIIAFSHPHGLGKRLSIGKYPDECEESHIKHNLPTAPGSSGANLICSYPERHDKFSIWWAAFVHYREHHAVAWQAIGPVLRKDFSLLS